jgi:hypothetical protein
MAEEPSRQCGCHGDACLAARSARASTGYASLEAQLDTLRMPPHRFLVGSDAARQAPQPVGIGRRGELLDDLGVLRQQANVEASCDSDPIQRAT